MSLRTEIEVLRDELERLAGQGESNLTQRYALWHPPGQRRTLYRRLRRALGRLLRRLHLRPTQPLEPWLPGLKHAKQSEEAKALVIWALDTDREQLREACRGKSAGRRIRSDLVAPVRPSTYSCPHGFQGHSYSHFPP